MRKVNIQRDVESRKQISSSLPTIFAREKETEVEISIITENAESKVVQEHTSDPDIASKDNPKKGKRATKGNV